MAFIIYRTTCKILVFRLQRTDNGISTVLFHGSYFVENISILFFFSDA